jgi:holo-[acyl-carrier protein] synthase
MELGADIVEIARIRSLAKRNPRFLKRVFSDEEIAYCRGKKLQWQHFAVRFAAKEAVWKAFGDAKGLSYRDITVSRDERGRPWVNVKGKKAKSIKLSLSHSERYALAVAAKA